MQAKQAKFGERGGPKAQPQTTAVRQGQQQHEDFDAELRGLRVTVTLVNGERLQGVVYARSRFWLKLFTEGGGFLYVNKSHVVSIKTEGVQ